MINAIGDSHVLFLFSDGGNTDRGMPGVARYYLGPRTMRRVSHLYDRLLPDTFAGLAMKVDDVALCCFGEIDMRCHLHNLIQDQKEAPVVVIKRLVARYLHRIQTLETGEGRVGVVNVVPPVPQCDTDTSPDEFPVAGTEQERSEYVAAFNFHLHEGCYQKGIILADVYSAYVGDGGLMRAGCSDGHVHVRNNDRVPAVLASMGVPPKGPLG